MRHFLLFPVAVAEVIYDVIALTWSVVAQLIGLLMREES